jgi:hypothetical protein
MPDAMVYTYRMPAGAVGDVTRMTPAAIIEPCASDPTNPPQFVGQAVTVDAVSGGVRPVALATELVYGIVVRAFPTQVPNASGYYGAQGFGSATPWLAAGQPPANVDVLRQGYILVAANGATRKGGRVWVWISATAAPHVQGGFEAADQTTNSQELPASCTFNGAADANGNVELAFNIGLS